MRRVVVITFVLAACLLPCVAKKQVNIQAEIETRVLQPSVMIEARQEDSYSGARGTGVIFVTDKGAYIVTAAHLTKRLREEIEEVRDGRRRIKTIWHEAKITRDIIEGGRKVGEIWLYAKVVKCSKPEEQGGDDVAVLRILKRDFINKGAKFLPDGYQLYVSQRVYHVGSLYGELGGSLSNGIISGIGRLIRGKPFNQTTCVAAPGSSGGGIFVRIDDKFYYAGMVVRGTQGTVNLFVPVERIKAWLKANKLGFIVTNAR